MCGGRDFALPNASPSAFNDEMRNSASYFYRLAAPVLLFLFSALPAAADRDAARKLQAEGNEAYARGDNQGAIKAYTRGIQEDPTLPELWYNRAKARQELDLFVEAVQDLSVALEIRRGEPIFLKDRAMNFLVIDRPREALADVEALLAKTPDDPSCLCIRGRARVRIGLIDQADEDYMRAASLGASDGELARYEVCYSKADWKALQADIEGIEKRGHLNGEHYLYKIIALTELGRYREAYAITQAYHPAEDSQLAADVAYGYLLGTPAAGELYHPDESIGCMDNACNQTIKSFAFTARARVLFLAGQPRDCLDTLLARGPRQDFFALFWIGAAQWKLEMFAEARATFSEARRLNPYLSAQAKRVPGLEEFVASIDREIVKEAAVDPKRLSAEMATYLLTAAEIETLVRRYEFVRAAMEYEKLLPGIVSPVRKAEIEARVVEIKGMATAFKKLVGAVNKGGVFKTTVARLELTLKKADDRVFDFTIPKGSGKFPWAYLDPLEYCRFARQQTLTPEERFMLGVLLWDAGESAEGQKALADPLATSAGLKAALNAVIARKRGVEAPPGGFVWWKNRWATPEEKANLEKGLVRWDGRWVSTEDRSKLASGFIQAGGNWVLNDEKKLTASGFRKYKDKWMSGEDYVAARSEWADAWTEETVHYKIRTNQGESFAKDLAAIAENAWVQMREFYFMKEPALPAGTKMEIWAFRGYEDYRRYCIENKAEDHLNASGFANSATNVVVGWNKTGDLRLFLQILVHEAAHLYYFRVAPGSSPPSWHAEGLATWFEGFEPAADGWRFGRLPVGRVDQAREAMMAGTHLTLTDLLAGDAIALINTDTRKALLFYAEAWSFNFFLMRTDNEKYRLAFEEYRKAVMAGKKPALGDFFGDLKQLEKDWTAFVKAL